MRIAFITYEFPLRVVFGGAGRYAINITRELVKLGHQIVVFTPEDHGLQEEQRDFGNLEIVPSKNLQTSAFKSAAVLVEFA